MKNHNKQKSLEADAERYLRALEGMGAGLWDWDMVNDRVFLSKRWKNMLGYHDHELQNRFTTWKNLWHPDDAAKIQKAMDDYVAGQTSVYRIEHRLKHKDGSWHWISTQGELERDHTGKPIRWTGTNFDITDHKKTEENPSNEECNLKKRKQEKKAVNEKLQQSMKEAQKASQVKSDFLAIMSHELRTPLNGILGFSQILTKSSLDEQQREMVDIVIQSANELLGIISAILDFSVIDSRKLRLKPEKTDIQALAEQALQLFNISAAEKGLTLFLNVEERFPNIVEIDSLRLKQVLLNLLSNAVKFTDHGHITLTIKKNGIDSKKHQVQFHFSIQDTGIGIPKSHHDKIFEPFNQVDMTNTRKHEGIGLGLAIAKQLLLKMDSNLQWTSTVGEGSTFSFDLTLPYYEDTPSTSNNAFRMPLSQISFKKIMSQKTILITEDDPVDRRFTRTVLSKLSNEVTLLEAKNGREAFHLYRKHKPNLIFMDVIMPELDGYQATTMIRTYNEQVPIIAMTAQTFREDKEACMAVGMNDFITKPIHVEQLKQVLKKYLT